jgi:hypothetical protein
MVLWLILTEKLVQTSNICVGVYYCGFLLAVALDKLVAVIDIITRKASCKKEVKYKDDDMAVCLGLKNANIAVLHNHKYCAHLLGARLSDGKTIFDIDLSLSLLGYSNAILSSNGIEPILRCR